MVREFQAIVMAGGRGTRMTELTGGRPKCLLPIGNKPMVWYPLQVLERSGITDAIIVVLEQVKSEVQTALERCGLKIHLDFVGIPGAEDWGTADTLRFLSDKLKTDVLIMSCDMLTDVCLFDMLDLYRKHSPGIVALFFHPQPSTDTPVVIPGPKAKHKPERDLIGFDSRTSRLVFLASVSDFDDVVSMPRRLMRKHPRISMYSQLTDAHLYIIKKWVIDYLSYEKSFSTLKGEMIPYIVKKQSSKHNCQKKEFKASPSSDEQKKDLFSFAQEDELELMMRSMSFFNDNIGTMRPTYHDDPVRCYGFLAVPEKFGIRANTIAAYCDINRKIKERWASLTWDCEMTPIHPTSDIKSTQMDEACMVGEQSSIAEKTSIKACIIGAHCQIETKVQLTNCLLMNKVKIREGCVLSNCIVCDDVEICSNSTLKDCLVGSRHTVNSGSNHESEVLTDDTQLVEI